MHKILGLLFGVKDVKFRFDDDYIDRMSRRYSTGIFMLFALVVTTKQYVGSPIYCWAPAQFTDSHKSYANTICWVQNTYYVPLEEELPDSHAQRQMISYYQWTPMILLCQALLCYIPSLFWRFLCRRSGLNVSALMEAAVAGQRTNYSDIREKTVRYMVHQIDKYLMLRTKRDRGFLGRLKLASAKYCCLVYGRFYGNYLTIAYIFVKLLYLGNAVAQLYLLDVFLGTDYHMYGIDVLNRLIHGRDWMMSERFPRVTMCDFRIRHMNQLHKFVLQCVLPINLFSEKIFLFVWFWLCWLALVTALSVVKWTWKSLYFPGHSAWVKRQLRPMTNHKIQRDVVRKFAEDYLRRDGMFILRLIGNNIGSIAASEVLCGLWENYGPERRYAAEVPLDPEPDNNKGATLHLPPRRLHRTDSV